MDGSAITVAVSLNGREMLHPLGNTPPLQPVSWNPPDILIDIPCNICESHKFHRASERIPAGEFWAQKALDEQRARFKL
ncbi:MAG: hypothetical protein ACI8RN_003103 [Glaciecola sp.]|jgi:hypothetical protein